MYRVNVGCGSSPTAGWINFDNSASVRAGRFPVLVNVLHRVGLLDEMQHAFASKTASLDIRWADVAREIPLADSSAEVVYSSHMLEHLDVTESRVFLREAHRVLAPGGVLRVVVPDLSKLVDQYRATGDANAFLRATLLPQPRPRGVRQRLRALLYGHREHLWMYDAASLKSLLAECGFNDPRQLDAGQTTIPNSQPLDLYERADESVYVEARR